MMIDFARYLQFFFLIKRGSKPTATVYCIQTEGMFWQGSTPGKDQIEKDVGDLNQKIIMSILKTQKRVNDKSENSTVGGYRAFLKSIKSVAHFFYNAQ